MKRDLAAMCSTAYDIVVIGGGITGACIARDAALRGLMVALVEKGDFAGATTAASSKLIHGGLRYLQNLELSLVRESLRERRVWSNTAPHMIDPLTFLLPTSSKKRRDRVMKSIGLRLYDWLSYDRNRLDDPEKVIPAHKKLSREEAIALEPSLAADDLGGALAFYDYQMYSPERLALECILSAAEHGAQLANYAQVTGFLREEDRIVGVRVADKSPISAEPDAAPVEYELRGSIVINAAGPWADLLMKEIAVQAESAADISPARQLIRSKGIHLITRSLTNGHAVTVPSESTHFFILPWRGHSLLGTTDTVFAGHPDDVMVTERDIVDFLAVVNAGFPAAKLRRSDVLHFYAGLRPIVATTDEQKKAENEQPDSYTASRAAEVFDHEPEEGLKGVITTIGGKWTTSRSLAEQVVDLAVSKLGKLPIPCVTESTPTYGGDVGRFTEFKSAAVEAHTDYPATVIENLAKNYGCRMEEVLALAEADSSLAERLSPQFPDIAAEVVYAVRNEMALTVEDVLFRRTGLGTLGTPGNDVIAKVAAIMAKELGWPEERRKAHVKRTVAHFTPRTRSRAIVNPRSWGGRTGKIWPMLEARLRDVIGPVDAVFTDGPMAATRLARQALKDGMEQIISVGGDGTINEVVNGFFEDGRIVNPDAMLTVVSSGTGCDFRRIFGIPEKLEDQIARLSYCPIRPIDVGRITYIGDNGNEEVRYFDNVASFGLSGAADREVNRAVWAKKINSKYAFQWGVFKAFARYKNQPVRLQIDDTFDETINALTVAICNGQYFGAGMHIAPPAIPDDGLFHVVILADIGKFQFLRNINKVYRGEHLNIPNVRVVTGRKITATPINSARQVLLDIDGEAPGRLPATFELLPQSIYLRC
ncbi:MAG: FAD-dependent oxidoreductase [Candidatus Hydrogenedentes bacterium]|nr:FAD-dependent oxidoreductase [Candidatus Hydrogenedentota bacterium]